MSKSASKTQCLRHVKNCVTWLTTGSIARESVRISFLGSLLFPSHTALQQSGVLSHAPLKTFNRNGSLLFVAQRYHWIYLHGPAGRHIAG
jgi:hypothetical protein